MHEYDVTLKSILTRAGGSALAELSGFELTRWYSTELPVVRHRRADLLGETNNGQLVHIELQSTNQAHMAVRMLEYAVAIRRKFRRFPRQVVLYVGNAPLRMKRRLKEPDLDYRCRFVDIREFDSEALLASGSLEDNLIAVLARFGNERELLRRVLSRIARCDAGQRGAALGELMVLAGLRRLGTAVEREISQMPILDDIMDHEVLGRERRRGMEIGRAEGRVEGRVEGRAEGERKVIVRMIRKRFGSVPKWAMKRVETLSDPERERVELRLLDAASLEELLG